MKVEQSTSKNNKTSLPIKVGFIFLHFFQIVFKKSVDNIVQKCYTIIVREIPLTIKKGVKYEKIGKKKATQNEDKTKFQNQAQLVYILLRVDD